MTAHNTNAPRKAASAIAMACGSDALIIVLSMPLACADILTGAARFGGGGTGGVIRHGVGDCRRSWRGQEVLRNSVSSCGPARAGSPLSILCRQ